MPQESAGRRYVQPVEKKIDPAGQPARVRTGWLLVERVAWICGLAVFAVWGAANVAGIAGARQDLQRFEVLRAARSEQSVTLPETAAPDLSLWDLDRVKAWRATLAQAAPSPLGILRIPKIRLEVAVLPGTDEFVLNRGVGHIEDSAEPGADGNTGIAGHRDGFFRGLKDVAIGDAIELETLERRLSYHVDRTWVVGPDDVSVLDATRGRALTLVTCYPFYFVGPAPQRFIVRATEPRSSSTTETERRLYGSRSW